MLYHFLLYKIAVFKLVKYRLLQYYYNFSLPSDIEAWSNSTPSKQSQGNCLIKQRVDSKGSFMANAKITSSINNVTSQLLPLDSNG